MKAKTYDLKIRWYCRTCWQRGIAGVTIREGGAAPTNTDLLTMARICHHQLERMDDEQCRKPDVRLVRIVRFNDQKERKAN